ncbi:hypothetical protein [Actinomadura flavalba]|uniref:hypothetical protein n=1 Tax=Actinomadura flavalba TaxID=1120938 RepID=UPI000378ABE6|nr:hypothetical protein [Actinomadura flavalba]
MSETNGIERGGADREPPADDAPEADAAEQRAGLNGDAEPARWPEGVPLEADEGDVAEQSHEIADGEEEYR